MPDVLELRIHGVNNSPPAEILDLPDDKIEQVEGDELGSFWRPKPDALAGLTPADRGYVPPGIQREAYSWGGLARTSIGGSSGIGKALNVAGRFAWSLLIPFGLVNVAYWSRRLARQPSRTPSGRAQGTGPDAFVPLNFANRAGGGALRFAGLLLTLLTAATAAVLSLDYLGVQCFSGGASRCSALPDWAGFLYGWSMSRRLALLSLVPLALIGFLWFLAGRARTRYERATADPEASTATGSHAAGVDAARAVPRWPLLSTRGFWNHAAISGATATLHLSAVAVSVAALTAWHLRFGGGRDCSTTPSFLAGPCRVDAAAGHPWAGSLVAIGLYAALLVVIAVVVILRTDDAADIQGPEPGQLTALGRRLRAPAAVRWLAMLSGLALLHQLVALVAADFDFPLVDPGALTGPGSRVYLVGMSTAVLLVLALLVGIALSALTWRYVAKPWPVLSGLGFATTLLLSGAFASGPVRVGLKAAAAVLLFVTVLPVFVVDRGQDGPRRRYQMWGGCAPGVLLLLATLMCFTIGSSLVVLAGNVLNGNLPPASLARIDAVPQGDPAAGCASECPAPDPFALTAPSPYVWFGALLLLVLAVWLVVVAVAVYLQTRGRTALRPDAEAGAGRQGGPGPGWDHPGAPPMMRGGRMGTAVPPGPVARAVEAARALARHAHRAEKGTALLTYAATIALAGSVTTAVTVIAPVAGTWQYGAVTNTMGWGMWVLIGVGTGVVALSAGGAQGEGQRPLGLFWDLICFLPRAGHPFGPPCYAERVVPELLGRYRWWLSHEGQLADGQLSGSGRSVVVSAHSLGGALACATVLAATPDPVALTAAPPATGRVAPGLAGAEPPPDSPLPRLSLLTYGVQLRAYFSRIFPELLGPDVLGSPPCRAADGTAPDPWRTERREAAAGTKPVTPVVPDSVRGRFGGDQSAPGRWLSLWRLTDPLGFPVHLYPDPLTADTAFDRYAEEVDRTAYLLTTLGHGEYFRTAAYAGALARLSGVPWS